MFENLQMAPPDPILGLTDAFKKDPNPNKINLGVGVFQDESGKTPTLECVKRAEAKLLAQGAPKTYLPIEGSPEYGATCARSCSAANAALVSRRSRRTAQAPGGTGALRIAGDLARQARLEAHLGERPHLGQPPGDFPGRRPRAGQLRLLRRGQPWPRVRQDAGRARPRPGPATWCSCTPAATTRPASIRRLRSGSSWPTRPRSRASCRCSTSPTRASATASKRTRCLCACSPSRAWSSMVCSSFSKNFGLYNERVGAITLVARDKDAARQGAEPAQGHACAANYSNPPAHGGAVVTTVLGDPELPRSGCRK